MASDIIEVVRMTRPVVTRVLQSYRNQSDPVAAVDITGYTIKLIVKQDFTSPDADKLFDISASIVTASAGIYAFAFTSVHTCLPAGAYPGELRWWSGTPSGPPDDAIAITFNVLDAVEQYS